MPDCFFWGWVPDTDSFRGNKLWPDNTVSSVLGTNGMHFKWEFDGNWLSVSFQVINLFQQSAWLKAERVHFDLKRRMSHVIRLLLRKYFNYLFIVIRMMSPSTIHKSPLVRRSPIFTLILLSCVTVVRGDPGLQGHFTFTSSVPPEWVLWQVLQPNDLKIRIKNMIIPSEVYYLQHKCTSHIFLYPRQKQPPK